MAGAGAESAASCQQQDCNMPAFVDLTGKRFGRLTAVSVVSMAAARKPDHKYQDTVWLCRCNCGIVKHVTRGNLKNGSTISCRCFRDVQGAHSHKHPLWKRWSIMHDRCNNPKSKDWRRYGGRGIKVCERWNSFPYFLADMEATFFVGATLDRYPNNDGDYEPDNVRWATPKEQTWAWAKNRRAV